MAENESVDQLRTGSSRWVLAGLSLPMLLSALGTSIANVGLPAWTEEFAASFQDVQWIVLAYLLAVTTMIVSIGRLGDMVGRRRLLLAGILVFTGGSVLCGAAPGLWPLVAARAVQGLGAAAMMALALSLVRDAVPEVRTGSAMGLLGTMSAVGTALGPSLGGILFSGFGWQAMFLINVPLGVAAFALAHRCLPASPQPPAGKRARFDTLGMLLLALTLAAYALAMTMASDGFGPASLALLTAAAVGAVLFVLAQAKAASPLIQLALFRRLPLSASLIGNVLVMSVMMATLVVGPFYLCRALGLDAALVGLVMSAGPVVAALTGVPAGRSVDRFGARPLLHAGLAGMGAGCFALFLIPATFGVPGYVAPLMVITASYALFQAANNTAGMAGARSDQRGVVSGMLNLSRNLGLITGASAMGAVFALASGTAGMATAPAEAVAAGMRTTFAVGALLMLAALAITAAGSLFARRGAAAPSAA